jgi:hypothetical protein
MQLFSSIRYYLSPTLTPEKREFLQYTLENNGAKAAGSLSEATHVVSNSDRFEGWQDVGGECVVVTVRIIHHLLAVLIEFQCAVIGKVVGEVVGVGETTTVRIHMSRLFQSLRC